MNIPPHNSCKERLEASLDLGLSSQELRGGFFISYHFMAMLLMSE